METDKFRNIYELNRPTLESKPFTNVMRSLNVSPVNGKLLDAEGSDEAQRLLRSSVYYTEKDYYKLVDR